VSIPINVIQEAPEWFVLNKPAHTHCVAGKTANSIAETLSKIRPELAGLEDSGLVHRLDFETSGCLLVAKNAESHHRLAHQLRSGNHVQKFYLCLTDRPVSQTFLKLFFTSRYRASKKISVSTTGEPAHCGEIKIKELNSAKGFYLYEVELLGPGKRHQIRASFAHMKAPLLGDKLYGSKASFNGIALHSWRLRLDSVGVTCPPPASWPLEPGI